MNYLKTVSIGEELLQIGSDFHASPSLKPEFQIHIVQPGLSKAQANTPQLDLLAVTELYLKETYGVALAVIASE